MRRWLLAMVFAAAMSSAAPVAAQAATLVNSGGTLTYTAAEGSFNVVDFIEVSPGTVQVVGRAGPDSECGPNPAVGRCNDLITSAPGCTENEDGRDYTCAGVARVVADGGDLDDQLSASMRDATATLRGGDGHDSLQSGPGHDVLEGGAGNDAIFDGRGADTALGGPGDDALHTVTDIHTPDADLMSGGSGIDSFTYGFDLEWAALSLVPPISITLNGAADDGIAGEHDNVDVEDVFASAVLRLRPVPPDTDGPQELGTVTLVGDAAPNDLRAQGQSSSITGGAGSDVLHGTTGDDVINSRDWHADRVDCADGGDTVMADDLDTISDTCESARIDVVGPAVVETAGGEDRPPTVALSAPGAGATLETRTPTTLAADAADDRGVAKVQFLDDDRIVCEDSAAPYTCAYQPRGEDVGRNTLVAIAIDTSQQSATAVRTTTVGRFAPNRVSLSVTPRRDRSAPFRFRLSGRVALPPTVSAAVGCAAGVVNLQVKAGRRTIAKRRAKLKSNCTFARRVTFRNADRFARSGRLKFTARFRGNDVLTGARAVRAKR